jgi:hypothetical protein
MLDHGNIAKLAETRVVSPDEKYFIMENVNSQSKPLGDVIRDLKGTGRTMPHLEKLVFIKWAMQMTEAVRYLHETHSILNTDLGLWSWRVKHDEKAPYKYGNIVLFDFSKA